MPKTIPYRSDQAGTLVVIDMQAAYEAALHPWTTSNVKTEVTAARHSSWNIVILEFYGHQETIPQVMRPLLKKTRYNKFAVVEKDIPDGSDKVISVINEKGFCGDLIRVCGVNTHECVQETVNGLAIKLPESKVTVVTGACNCHTDRTWRDFHREPNVTLCGEWWKSKTNSEENSHGKEHR